MLHRRFFSTAYLQLYKTRKPTRGGDEVGARRRDIYSADVLPIRDDNVFWAYALPNLPITHAVVEIAALPDIPITNPADPDSLRRLELLTRVNVSLDSC